MTMIIDQRPADLELVDTIWQATSVAGGSFVSSAGAYLEIVITDPEENAPFVTLRGPATRATPLTYSAGSRWWGIRFRIGAGFPLVPARTLIDRAVSIPIEDKGHFQWNGKSIPVPGYENAEATIHRLMEAGFLVADPVVEAVWRGTGAAVSQRSIQRRFQQVAGLSQRTAFQISRARQALRLLQGGTSIVDTVHELGYSDQAHLTRALRRWTGYTPRQVMRSPQSILLA